MKTKTFKEIEIEVNLNDRKFFGMTRLKSENVESFFAAVRPAETSKYIFSIRIKRGGYVSWKYNDQFMTYSEASAMYFKIFREAEKHMEI